jgi:hypothetical protein
MGTLLLVARRLVSNTSTVISMISIVVMIPNSYGYPHEVK